MHHAAASAVCSPPAARCVKAAALRMVLPQPVCTRQHALLCGGSVSTDSLCVLVVGLQPVRAVVSKLTACDPALLVVQLLRKEHLCVVCGCTNRGLALLDMCGVLCLLRGLPKRLAQCWDVVCEPVVPSLFTTPLVLHTCWCKLWL